MLPDGTRNRMLLQRLKDKLGNHANASSEVEYDGATAWLVGEEGRGVPTIIEMVNLTRLDCTLGSATSMRTGLMRATHHAQHRKAFGAYLIDQPLMRNVLADLAVEAEAATMLAMRMAGATDRAVRGDERETLLRRIGLAAAKYWVCKRATPHAAEAMECLGGNGYAEESGMPRLYREAPLMGIWEGSGNVSALDTLRAIATRPECIEVLFDELGRTAGHDPRLDAHVEALRQARRRGDPMTIQYRARKIAEDISLALQGSLLVRHGHPAVAEAFLASRLGGAVGRGVRHAADRAGPRADHRACAGQGMTHAIRPVDFDNLKTMTYEVTGRVARITFNRPEKGNAIVAEPRWSCRHWWSAPTSTRTCTSSWCPVAAQDSARASTCPPTPRVRRRPAVAPVPGHRAVGQDTGGQPPAQPAVGPNDRLPDDQPVRPRVLQPAAR